MTVSFAEDGDPLLADGSEGGGVEPGSISAPVTFDTSGSHRACGTLRDRAGNESQPGCLTVQVDATPPSLELQCPASAILDSRGVAASFTATDGQSGLASPSSGSVPVPTGSLGEQTVSDTAVDNVGHETTSSCATDVVYAFSHLTPKARRKFAAGRVVAVKFKLADALGYVTDASATLEVAPSAKGVAGEYRPASSPVNSGDRFSAQSHGNYGYELATSGLSKGEWSLRVALSDGTVHTTAITIK